MPGLVRNLESIYATMWSDYTRGELPRPDLRNLDVYLTPLGAWATAKLDEAFRALSGGSDGGPRVLRTETAGLAAIAAFNALYGDWR